MQLLLVVSDARQLIYRNAFRYVAIGVSRGLCGVPDGDDVHWLHIVCKSELTSYGIGIEPAYPDAAKT